MTDDQLELRLRDWYRAEIPADETAPTALRSRLVSIPRVSPLPRRRFASRRGVTLLAAAALVGVLAGSAAIGARFVTPPPVPPVVTFSAPVTAPIGARIQSAFDCAGYGPDRLHALENPRQRRGGLHEPVRLPPRQRGDVQRRWLRRTGALPGSVRACPHGFARRFEADRQRRRLRRRPRLPDGRRGSEPRLLDTHCQTPCLGDWGFTLSADGSRLAFNRARAGEPGPTGEDLVVATMDMTTGAVVELESTHDNWARPGLLPDGSRIAFGNHVVDADGSNLQQIAPADLFTDEQFGVFSAGLAPPQWSPDRSLIAFASFNATIPNANLQALMEIYVVRPDGSGLQRLTTDTDSPRGREEVGDFGANFPTWTRDGRIAFIRYPAREEDLFELWVMDADGGNATRVEESNAAALTALGCVSCPYPARTYHEAGVPSFAFWIPGR